MVFWATEKYNIVHLEGYSSLPWGLRVIRFLKPPSRQASVSSSRRRSCLRLTTWRSSSLARDKDKVVVVVGARLRLFCGLLLAHYSSFLLVVLTPRIHIAFQSSAAGESLLLLLRPPWGAAGAAPLVGFPVTSSPPGCWTEPVLSTTTDGPPLGRHVLATPSSTP